MADASQWVVLAEVLRPQGRRGEVLAELLTDFPERFSDHPHVWLAPRGFADQAFADQPFADQASVNQIPEQAADNQVAARQSVAGSAPQPASVCAHWLPTGRNAGRIVLHFAGIDSIEQAEALSGKEVIIPLDERLPLEADSTYISDLVGATVYDGDLAVGIVAEVQFASSPDGSHRLDDAAPLLAVTTPEGEELLIPFVKAFLTSIDLPAKAIHMTLPEGLTEINRGPGKLDTDRKAGEEGVR